MIPAYLYNIIFIILVTVFTLSIISKYSTEYTINDDQDNTDEIICIFLVVFLSVFIGLRPPSGRYFGDTANYVQSYLIMEGHRFRFETKGDFLFSNLFSWWASNRLGYNSFFILINSIYFGCTYLGIRRIFPNHKLAAYLVFLGAFSTFSYATNGIRAGAAAAIFIWAISYRETLYVCIPLMLISLGFHHSMQLPIGAYILTLLYKKPEYYFYAWVLCVVIAFLHIGFFANLFASMTDESGAGYLAGNGSDGTKGGFRLDFILYSAMPVLVGYYMMFERKMEFSETYSHLLRLYICTNGIWMLCMYANFTNRIAYLSWFLYPIVLIYPFLSQEWGEDSYYRFSKYMLYHLAFTLFMVFVY